MSDYVAEPQLPLDIPYAQQPRQGRTNALTLRHTALDTARTRLIPIGAAFACFFLVAALRLVDATIIQADPATLAALGDPAANGAITTVRTDLTDRNGELLATSLPTQSLYVDPKHVLEPEEAARDLTETLPGLKYGEVLDKLKSPKRFVWIKRNLTPDEVLAVNALGHPGLEFQTEYTRFYPAGNAAVHVVGHTDVDGHGLAGVERGLDRLLMNGGAPVALSIDMRLQHIVKDKMLAAIKDFRAIGGAGIVMDIKTGEILAAVSLPDFNPVEAGEAPKDAIFSRFALGTYELGSVFKTFTIAAGLDNNRFTLDSFFDATQGVKYGRFTIRDYHPEHRWLSGAEVFIHSSNIGAARMALNIGTPAMQEFMTRLGLTSKLKTEIAEQGGVIAPREWRDINAMTISFGHGISVTPLHFMRALGATMTGTLIDPTFLKRDAPPVGKPILSASTVDQMRRLMRANVVLGSGKSAEVAGYYVGGKTGTAEKTVGKSYSGNARLSSFAGVFPMNDPRFAIYIMIDEPKGNAASQGYATGGWVAAPVVGKIVAEMAPLYGMAPVSPDNAAVRQALTLTVKSREKQLASY